MSTLSQHETAAARSTARQPTASRLRHISLAREAVLCNRESAPQPFLDPAIERSWRRCLLNGFDPNRKVLFEAVTKQVTRDSRETNRALLDAAAPVIRSLTRTMLHTGYFAILTDARGIVIDVQGPIDQRNPHVAAIARVGLDLSETAAGTTAIGTTLNELQPVWLHRGEHFYEDTTVFSCAGAPIFGPDRRCIGMLDLTGANVSEQPSLKHLVAQSARNIENTLMLSQPHKLMLRVNWPGNVPGSDSDGLLATDADGWITGCNRAAADMLNLNAQSLPIHCDDVFAYPCKHLFDAARMHKPATDLPLWSGLQLQVWAQAQDSAQPTGGPAQKHAIPLKDVETAMIRKAVDQACGSVAEAARMLGISRATVYRKMGRN
jgi:transcriptional regulator of acetoin/glycerol metabolism